MRVVLPGIHRQRILAAALALLLGAAGCNIFSWTHDRGSSNDPQVLLQDAEDAVLGRDYDAALRCAEKGIARDPGVEVPRLRYVAAQAVLARGNISISSYLNVFTNRSGKARPAPGGPHVEYDILDLSPETLSRIASSCPAAVRFLQELLDALEDGRVRPEDLSDVLFDVYVGYGVGQLLTAFVTLLDEDRDLGNGFTKTPLVTVQADANGGYVVSYAGPSSDSFIRCELWCPLQSLFCQGLEGIYDAYLEAKGLPPDDLCAAAGPPGPLPFQADTGLVIGQVLEFTYDGVVALYRSYGSPDDCRTLCPATVGAPR